MNSLTRVEYLEMGLRCHVECVDCFPACSAGSCSKERVVDCRGERIYQVSAYIIRNKHVNRIRTGFDTVRLASGGRMADVSAVQVRPSRDPGPKLDTTAIILWGSRGSKSRPSTGGALHTTKSMSDSTT